MRAFLHGSSSLSVWLVSRARPESSGSTGSHSLQSCAPTRSIVDHLSEQLPTIPLPYHLSTPPKGRSSVKEAVAHASTFDYQGKPFIRIGSGLYASCPELCFVQLALDLPLHELAKAGNALCSRFFIEPPTSERPGGLGARSPLTSIRRIEAFIRRNPGMHGSKQARRALGLMVDNAASPPEMFLWSILCLPQRYGGYGLPRFVMNHRIYPSKRAQAIAHRTTLIPDLLHEGARVVIEYDSNSEHLTASQITRDSTKRMALEADGYKTITVTTRQLADPAEMRHVAEQASKCLGHRMQVRGAGFAEQHRRLYRAGWSLERYYQTDCQPSFS